MSSLFPRNVIDGPSTWTCILDEAAVEAAVDRCAKALNEKFIFYTGGSPEGRGSYPQKDTGPPILLPILRGAVYFAVDLSRKLLFDHKISFIEVSSYGNRSDADAIHCQTIGNYLSDQLTGRDIIIIDELFDRGETLQYVTDLVRKMDIKSITTCTAMIKGKERPSSSDVRTSTALSSLTSGWSATVWMIGGRNGS